MEYNEYTLEELEEFLAHEQQKADACTDEYTKQLLLNRCKMYQNNISDIKGKQNV